MNYIDGAWRSGTGELFSSLNPVDGEAVWTGRSASVSDVAEAVGAAENAFSVWQSHSFEERLDILHRFAEELRKHLDELAELISLEVGKPFWESRTEVEAMIAKIPVTEQAYRERCQQTTLDLNGTAGVTRYRPHGAVAVFGPFNFPGHIANGHIVPALLAGNTVVFKPSELTPGVGEFTVKLWENTGIPHGVINLVQGGPDTGAALVNESQLRGILFTGSVGVGVKIRQALVDRPEVMLALELGGNNPLVVHNVQNVDAAVYWTIQSAYLTSGQRCTCARRLIVTHGNEDFLDHLQTSIGKIVVGRPHDEPSPFMGPVIHAQAAENILAEQKRLLDGGAKSLVEMQRLSLDSYSSSGAHGARMFDERPTGADHVTRASDLCGARATPLLGSAFLSPGLIDVTNCSTRDDCEVFGPLLQVIRVPDLEAAIAEANATRFGLVAALFTDSREDFDLFNNKVRSGLVNWNRPTTGASAHLPFGGTGQSGNHRPAGYFMVDSCSSPIASLESDHLLVPVQPSPGLQWP